MRARIAADQKVMMSRKEIEEQIKTIREYDREGLYKQCADDIMIQALCVVLWTLTTQYGWRRKRLRNFVSALQSTNDLMSTPSNLHHRFSPLDCENMLKERFKIDLRKEFQANVIMK